MEAILQTRRLGGSIAVIIPQEIVKSENIRLEDNRLCTVNRFCTKRAIFAQKLYIV